MTPVQILKRAYNNNIAAMARDTGIKYQTLYKLRLTDERIGTLTLNEFWALQRHGYYTDEEVLQIARYGK